MKEFADALLGKLTEAIGVLAPGALLVAATLGMWHDKQALIELRQWPDSLVLVLGLLLTFTVGFVLLAWSTQGCALFYATRARPARLRTRAWLTLVHWMPCRFHWEHFRVVADSTRELGGPAEEFRLRDMGENVFAPDENPWHLLLECRMRMNDMPGALPAAAREADVLHERVEFLLSCSLALTLVALQLGVRIASLQRELGWNEFDQGRTGTSIVLAAICVAGSLGVRVLAANYWAAEARLTVAALRAGSTKVEPNGLAPR